MLRNANINWIDNNNTSKRVNHLTNEEHVAAQSKYMSNGN